MAGALIGAAMNALDVSVTLHLLVATAIVGVGGAAGDPLVPSVHRSGPRSGADRGEPTRSPFAAWKEPRTVLIGLFVLTMAFTEGTGNDWLGVATIDGYGASDCARLAGLRALRGVDDGRSVVRPAACSTATAECSCCASARPYRWWAC